MTIPTETRARIFAAYIGSESICNVDDAIYFDKNEKHVIDFQELRNASRINVRLLITSDSAVTPYHSLAIQYRS